MRAVRVTSTGGPEVLRAADLPDPRPGPGQLLVRVEAAGVNFIDVYRRDGTYPVALPDVPGSEGAGTVVALGEGARGAVGDRVAWADAPGSYAQLALVAASRALAVPDGVDLADAAALPLQGMTAHYLTTSTFPVVAGQDVLVHAGAGGTGALVVQMAAARGARVIATTSTAAKAELAREAGAAHVLRYDAMDDLAGDLPAAVREIAPDGVHAVYDGVGATTFDASLASLRRRGTLVLFGASSGPVAPVDPQRLNAAGSVFLTRPTLVDHVADPEELARRAGEVFAAAADGSLRVRVGHRYPLAEAARAHADLQSRATTGKLLLLPGG